ncbi:hypothetical protein NHQ30_008822 [Ciborinia camelliae]|nr:hypothetical protein NHQ30_008822 [Ciborinia camelliae]
MLEMESPNISLRPFVISNQPTEWLTKSLLLTSAHTESSNPTSTNLTLDAYHPRDCPPLTTYSFHLGPNPPPKSTRHILKIPAKSHGESTSFDILSIPSLPSDSKQPGSSSAPLKLYSSTGEPIIPGKRVTAFAVETQKFTPSPIQNGGGDLFIPIHEACMEVTENYFTTTSKLQLSNKQAEERVPTDDRITDIYSFWEVLYRRLFGETVPLSYPYILDEPHDYYGGRSCRNVYWEPDDDETFGPLLEANPLSIPEIEDMIIQHTSPTSDSLNTRTSTSISPSTPPNLPPIPWLWDLNTSSIIISLSTTKPTTKSTPNTTFLSIYNILANNSELYIPPSSSPTEDTQEEEEPTEESEDEDQEIKKKKDTKKEAKDLPLPLGLRNRRRIWKILEMARVGDVEGMEGSVSVSARGDVM